VAPTGTPAEVADRLRDALGDILADKERKATGGAADAHRMPAFDRRQPGTAAGPQQSFDKNNPLSKET
jgi:hypothetical protein